MRDGAYTLDEKFAEELYKQGKTDQEIAKSCFVKESTIVAWRKRNGLESQSGQGRKRRRSRDLTQLEWDAMQARTHDMSYGQWMSSPLRGKVITETKLKEARRPRRGTDK